MSTQVPPRDGDRRKPPARPSGRGKQSSFKAQKRRQQRTLAIVAGALVVVVALAFVIVKVAGGGSDSGIDATHTISSSSLAEVLSVTPAEMKSAAQNVKLNGYPQAITDPLTSGGKPEVLYMGAEYCPFCAGERWPMVMALSQFGTFSGLKSITSNPTDSAAQSIPTFTFVGSTYSSPYLTFTPVEMQTVSEKTLQKPTAAQEANLAKYDGPPYVPSNDADGIPFINLGGKYVQDGINFTNASMQHESFDTVAGWLSALNGGSGSTTSTGVAIAATAGVLVSHLCQITGGRSLNGDAACKLFPTPITSPTTS